MKQEFLSRYGERILLGLLVVAVSSVHVMWILQDTRPQPGPDPNHYLIKTFEFLNGLGEQGDTGFWDLVAGMSLQGRPPLYQLAAVPFIALLGRSEDAALGLNVVLGVVLVLATYGFAKLAGNGRVGLLASFLVACYPPIINLVTIYRPHAALPAWTALSLWLLLFLLQTRSVILAWLLGLALGLGMLIHLNFLYLVPVPAAAVGLYLVLFHTAPRYPVSVKAAPRWLWAKLRDPLTVFGLVPAALIAVGLVASWYLPRMQSIVALQRAVGENWADQTYGFSNVPHSFWWYALTSPGAVSYGLVALFVVGLVVGIVKRRQGSMVLIAIFLAMYTALGLRLGDRAWLHFAPVLPVVAAITATGMVDLSRLLSPIRIDTAGRRRGLPLRIGRIFSIVVILICVVIAAFSFFYVALGGRAWSDSIAGLLGAPLDSSCRKRMNLAFCPNPARAEAWQVNDILRLVLDDPECQARTCRLVVVPKVDSFNSFVFDYHLVRDFPEARENIRVITADGWGGEGADGEWVVSEYLLYVPDPLSLGTDRGKKVRAAVSGFLESPPPGFAKIHQEVGAFALPTNWTAKLIKRTRPLTVDAEVQSYEEAVEAVPMDIVLYEKLGYLHLRAGSGPRAEEQFLHAAQMDPSLGWPYRALGYLYQAQGLEDQAIVAFRKAMEKEPFDPRAYHHLADLFVARGDLQEAIRIYEQAVQHNPGSVWPHLERGSVYVRAGQLSEARAAYQQAARIEPWNQTARANLRDLHWSLASNLGTTRAHTNDAPLVWWRGEAWIRPYPNDPDVLVGRSVLPTEGSSQPDQILLHPFGADQVTTLRFEVDDCRYETLQVGYGLPDQVTGLSNGVRYSLQVSADGGRSWTELLRENVTESVWKSQTLPLIAYWGEDVTIQLAVDALGEDAYDWLQTTVRLFPAGEVWDLAIKLAAVQVAAMDETLSWNGSSAWVDGDARPLVTLSQAPVQGTARDNQVQFHPFSQRQDTNISLLIEDNPYSVLRTAFALADEAVGRSDGVGYAIAIRSNGGPSFDSLLERQILQNTWESETLDLRAYLDQDLVIRLVSSSLGDADYDWLQVTLQLIAARGQAQDHSRDD